MDPLQGGLTEPLSWLLLGVAFAAATADSNRDDRRGSNRRGQGPQGTDSGSWRGQGRPTRREMAGEDRSGGRRAPGGRRG
jgi:hypothetical protein